ncbi:serine/threonine-protein phosphatase, partial [bacterium]
FLMATTQLIVRLILNRTKDVTLTMNEANRALCDQVYSGQFVTLQVLVIDREAGTLDVVNAGHPPPVLIANGRATLLSTQQQIVLGVDEDAEYTLEHFALPPECAMLLYTDGVVECRAPTGERFSIPLLVAALEGAPIEPTALIERVTKIVNDFRVDEPLADDTSAVAVHFSSIEAGGEPAPRPFVAGAV